MNYLKINTATTIKLGSFIDITTKAPRTDLTISQADIRLSKNGGDIAQSNNSAGATHDENGYYDIPLDTTDINTLGRLKLMVYKSGAEPVSKDFMVVTSEFYDTLCGSDKFTVDVSTTGLAAIGDAVLDEPIAEHLTPSSFGCSISQIPKDITVTYYVSVSGNDSNDGRTPCTPFATIGKAIQTAVPGCTLRIGKGSYVENGLVLNKNFITMEFEYGATIVSTTGYCLTISGGANYFHLLSVQNYGGPTGASGIYVSGEGNLFDTCDVSFCKTGYNIAGDYNYFRSTRSVEHFQEGYNITGKYNAFVLCLSPDSTGQSIGFYVSSNTADHNIFLDCGSIDNHTSIEVVEGANRNTFTNFTYSIGELPPIDNGDINTWIGGNFIQDQIWDSILSSHQNSGSTGEALSNINETTEIISPEIKDSLWLLKNKVVKEGNLITIYEDDNITIWKQFDLSDGGRVEI